MTRTQTVLIEPAYSTAIRRALSLLLIVFLVLRGTGLVDWSWGWVLAPLWMPVYLAAVAPAFYLVARRWSA